MIGNSGMNPDVREASWTGAFCPPERGWLFDERLGGAFVKNTTASLCHGAGDTVR